MVTATITSSRENQTAFLDRIRFISIDTPRSEKIQVLEQLGKLIQSCFSSPDKDDDDDDEERSIYVAEVVLTLNSILCRYLRVRQTDPQQMPSTTLIFQVGVWLGVYCALMRIANEIFFDVYSLEQLIILQELISEHLRVDHIRSVIINNGLSQSEWEPYFKQWITMMGGRHAVYFKDKIFHSDQEWEDFTCGRDKDGIVVRVDVDHTIRIPSVIKT